MARMMDLDALKKDLRRDEGLRLKPYRDTVGKVSVGIGRNLDDVGISEDEADYLLINDIFRAVADLDRSLPWWRDLSEARQRALANMCFNLGLTRLLGFRKLLAALEAGRWDDAYDEALDSRWADQVGARSNRIADAFRYG